MAVSDAPFPLDVLLEPGADALEQVLIGWLGPSPRTSVATTDAPAANAATPVAAAGERSIPVEQLPAAVANGLATLARWPGVFRRNQLRAPDAVDAVDGLGRFLVEGEGHGFWGYALGDAALADPRV